MVKTLINTLCSTYKAVNAVVLFNNPEPATYTAWQVGDALGYIYEGWRISEIKGQHILLVCDGQPDRVVTMDGKVRVRHQASWRVSRNEKSLMAVNVGTSTLIVGDTFPVKEVFKHYGAEFIKNMPVGVYGGEPACAWSFHGNLPSDVADLLHAPVPGAWQCVVALLQGSPIWLEGDHTNIGGIVSGFCARTGNVEWAEALGTGKKKTATVNALMANAELWETFIPAPVEKVVEEVVQPVIEVVVNVVEDKPAKKKRASRSKGNGASKKHIVSAMKALVKGDLATAARAFGMHDDTLAGAFYSDDAELEALLGIEAKLEELLLSNR